MKQLVSENDVRQIINKHDLESLLKMKCPEDEYEKEIHDIFEGINANHPHSPQEVANIISLVWFWHFGEWNKTFPYSPWAMEPAKEIWEIIQRDSTH